MGCLLVVWQGNVPDIYDTWFGPNPKIQFNVQLLLFGVTTADHPSHIFDFGSGFFPYLTQPFHLNWAWDCIELTPLWLGRFPEPGL